MLHYVTRLQTHSKLNLDEVALPDARGELAPRREQNLPVLIFDDLGPSETIAKRLEKYEKLNGAAPGSYSLSNEDFWDNLFIVVNGDEMTILDDTKPLDAIKVAFAKAKRNVARKKSDKGGSDYQYLMISAGEQEKTEVSKHDLLGRAYAILSQCEDKRQLLVLIGTSNKVNDVAKLSDDAVHIRLGRYVNDEPDTVTAAWEDPLRATKYSLRRAIAKGVVFTNNGTYYLADKPNAPVAHGEKEMVLWMRDPENSEQRHTLEAKIQ